MNEKEKFKKFLRPYITLILILCIISGAIYIQWFYITKIKPKNDNIESLNDTIIKIDSSKLIYMDSSSFIQNDQKDSIKLLKEAIFKMEKEIEELKNQQKREINLIPEKNTTFQLINIEDSIYIYDEIDTSETLNKIENNKLDSIITLNKKIDTLENSSSKVIPGINHYENDSI